MLLLRCYLAQIISDLVDVVVDTAAAASATHVHQYFCSHFSIDFRQQSLKYQLVRLHLLGKSHSTSPRQYVEKNSSHGVLLSTPIVC